MNAFMPPPPVQPINGDGGQFSPNKPIMTDQPQPGQFMPTFNFHFNPGGGVGNGFMPPPPIQPINSPGGGFKPQPQRRTAFPTTGTTLTGVPGTPPAAQAPGPPITGGFGPQRGMQQQMPGWAGYLQWLRQMGGRFPPPPVQGT